MAAKSSVFDNDLLKLIFNGTAIANIADNAASSPLANIYASLHTSSPGTGGNQTTNEATYGSYARVAITRTSGGWTITGSSVSPNSNISFPAATSGTETLTYMAVGTASSGAGKILYFGALNTSINVTTSVAPNITTATIIQES
jgi:hypothetical protein